MIRRVIRALLILSLGALIQVQIGLGLGRVAALSQEPQAMFRECLYLGGWLLLHFIYDWLGASVIRYDIEGYFEKKRNELVRIILYSTRSEKGEGDAWMTATQTIQHLADEVTNKWIWIAKRSLLGIASALWCLWLSPRLALFYFALLPGILWAFQHLSRRSQTLQKRVLEQKGKMAELALDVSRGRETVLAYAMEPIMEQRMERENQAVFRLFMESDRQRVWLTLVKYIASVACLFLVSLTGGGVPVGTLVAFVALSQYVQGGLEMLDQVFYSYRLCKADWEKIQEISRYSKEAK